LYEDSPGSSEDVDRYSPRSLKVEDIIDSVAQNRRAATRHNVRQCVIWISCLHKVVIVIEVAHKDSRLGAHEFLQWLAGALEGFICHFEQLPLARVKRHGLGGRHPKERVVEPARILAENMTAPCEHAPRTLAVGMIEAIDIDMVGLELTPTVPFFSQQVP
jgi:hypothetical protein